MDCIRSIRFRKGLVLTFLLHLIFQIELCKNATFSLKLVARRIPKQSESAVLTETMEKCVALLNQWQTLDETMVGNVLFLAGELIRFASKIA